MFARLFRSALRELVDRLLRWALAEVARGLDSADTADLFRLWLDPCRRLALAIVRASEARTRVGRRFWERRQVKLRRRCDAMHRTTPGGLVCATDVAERAADMTIAHLASQRARKGRT